MKKRVHLLAMFVLLLTTLNPQTAFASNSFVWKLKGESVSAYFSNIDEAGCLYTDVWIFASNEMIHQPPGPGTWTPMVIVLIQQVDVCKNVTLTAVGSAPLDKSDLQIDGNLSSATLTATVPLIDWWTEEHLFDVSIDLTWTATSGIALEHLHDQYRTDTYHLNQQILSKFRFAIASGTVSNGETNFTPQPAVQETTIANVKSGFISQGTE